MKSPTEKHKQYSIGSVISKDGTVIGYRQFGQGPGLVLVQGTMGTAQHFIQLALALADTFTVYVPDRRGRGMSNTNIKEYNAQKEVEDLDALLIRTGTHNVFGLSSGAFISLQAALDLPEIHKLAIFEPPIFKNGVPVEIIARYDEEMSQGKMAAALVTGMLGGQMGPPIFNLMPRRLLESLVNMGIKNENRKGSGDYPPMSELAATLHNDFQIISEMNDALQTFASIRTEMLLLGGSKSPTYLKVAMDIMEKLLPHAKRVELPGLGHAAAWNMDRGGQPQLVAKELLQFFF